jgi:hypothetical protein
MIDGRALSLTAVLAILLSLPSCSDNRTRGENVAEPVADQVGNAAVAPSEVPRWVTAEAGPSRDCPLTVAEGSPDDPYFELNGTTGAPDFRCRQTGPFQWGGKTWFVQRIHSLTTNLGNPKCAENGLKAPCLFDGTRACSTQAKLGEPTPAGATAGGKGCAVHEPSKFRKKP